MSSDAHLMRWTGKSFACHPRHMDAANQLYKVGDVYRVLTEEERSDVSHNHEFAFVAEAWKNLPEHLADEFPSPDHLRRWALIKAGFYDEQIIDVGTRAGAERVRLGFLAAPGEAFSHIVMRGTFVVIRRAKSQSRRSMNREQFQASKQAILDILSEMLGVESGDLQRARAA